MIGIFGFLGLKKTAKWIEIKYTLWSGKKCKKCKDREPCQ